MGLNFHNFLKELTELRRANIAMGAVYYSMECNQQREDLHRAEARRKQEQVYSCPLPVDSCRQQLLLPGTMCIDI